MWFLTQYMLVLYPAVCLLCSRLPITISILECGGCPFARFMVDVSAVVESVWMVSSWAWGCNWRALAIPALSPSATDPLVPRRWSWRDGSPPQVVVPVSVIAPPASFPYSPEPPVKTLTAVGLFGRTALTHESFSRTFGCPGCRFICRFKLGFLPGYLEPKERAYRRLVVVLVAAPIVESSIA